jgi:hypothetical protein
MSDISKGEAHRAAREALDGITPRPRGSRSGAIAGALRRYLSAETYEQRRRRKAERDEERKGGRNEG